MFLEDRLAILIITKILEELLHSQSESLVLWVLVELIGEELNLIHDTVRMVTVTVPQEEIATIVELVPFFVGSVLHDESLLLEALSDKQIHVLEPSSEFGILLGITVDVVDGLKEVIGRSAIGEALDHCLELSQYDSILTQIP